MNAQPYNLILVIGAMRSGTTLLQQILCSSPESNPFIHGCRYLTSQIAIYAQYADSDRLYIDDYLGGPDNLFAFTRDILERLLSETHRRLDRPSALVLKNPELSGYLHQAAELLPDARFVVSVRDPKDTIASMIDVGERHRKQGINSFLAGADRDIARLCTSYRQFYMPVLNTLRNDMGDLHERVCFVTYESLITDNAPTIARLSDFCGLPLTAEAIGKDDSWRSQVDLESKALSSHPRWSAYLTKLSGGPISASSIGRYQEVLSQAETDQIDQHCAELYGILRKRAS